MFDSFVYVLSCIYVQIKDKKRWNSVSKLFSVYVDDLYDKLVESKVECSIDNLCIVPRA